MYLVVDGSAVGMVVSFACHHRRSRPSLCLSRAESPTVNVRSRESLERCGRRWTPVPSQLATGSSHIHSGLGARPHSPFIGAADRSLASPFLSPLLVTARYRRPNTRTHCQGLHTTSQRWNTRLPHPCLAIVSTNRPHPQALRQADKRASAQRCLAGPPTVPQHALAFQARRHSAPVSPRSSRPVLPRAKRPKARLGRNVMGAPTRASECTEHGVSRQGLVPAHLGRLGGLAPVRGLARADGESWHQSNV